MAHDAVALLRTPASILLVEDDAAARELLRIHLANAGYDVVCAADAIEAGRILVRRMNEIALVIADAHLPFFSGIELIATLMADTTLPAIPAVLITGHEHLAPAAERLGVPCLFKPFAVADLLRVVRQAMQAPTVEAIAEARQVASAGAADGGRG
jgi:DNA-binding NtrC family response regulator